MFVYSVGALLLAGAVSAIKVKEDAAVSANSDESMLHMTYIRPSFLRRQCPIRSSMGMDVAMYACPSADQDLTSFTCVRYEDLCNGITDCPNGEDELVSYCMFHKLYEHQQSKVVRELKRIGEHLKDEIKGLAEEVDKIQTGSF